MARNSRTSGTRSHKSKSIRKPRSKSRSKTRSKGRSSGVYKIPKRSPVLATIPNYPSPEWHNVGHNANNEGTNTGYNTAVEYAFRVDVYTVATNLGDLIAPLPIPNRGRLDIKGKPVSFDVHLVTYHTLLEVFQTVSIDKLDNINEQYQTNKTDKGLSVPNAFYLTVTAMTGGRSEIIGIAVGSLKYAAKGLAIVYPDRRTLAIEPGDPYIHYDLLGVTKTRLQLDSGFHGSHLLSLCIRLFNQPEVDYIKKVGGLLTQGVRPLDRLPYPLYLEAIIQRKRGHKTVVEFYQENGFVPIPPTGDIFVHPLQEGEMKDVLPMVLLDPRKNI